MEKAFSPKKHYRNIKFAERLHAAEEAAARVAAENLWRAERSAEKAREKAANEAAIAHALKSIGGSVIFENVEAAAGFLKSVGLETLAAFVSSTTATKVAFPLNDDDELKVALGTSSSIVLRKVKRELLKMLEERSGETVAPSGEVKNWGTKEVSEFIDACGGDATPF